MGLKIDLESELLKKLPKKIKNFSDKTLVKSARQGINKTVNSTTTFSSEQIRMIRKIKKSSLKRFIDKGKARGSTLAALEGNIEFSNRPVGLIEFISGSRKAPRPKQKGVEVRRRKPFKREVRPGRKVKTRGEFIAKGRGGKNQVFQRRGKSRFPIARQAVPGIARLVERVRLRTQIEKFTGKRLVKEFDQALEFNLTQLK